MTTPEDTELREMLELDAETIETDDGEYLAVDIDRAMNLITLHTQKALLNELSYFYEDEDGEARRFEIDENGEETLGLNDRIAQLINPTEAGEL